MNKLTNIAREAWVKAADAGLDDTDLLWQVSINAVLESVSSSLYELVDDPHLRSESYSTVMATLEVAANHVYRLGKETA